MLKSKKYAVVISDVQMEEMSGLEFLDLVRHDEELKHTHFIMISAHKQAQWVSEAAKRGADCFIMKPFSPAQLQQKLESILGRIAHRVKPLTPELSVVDSQSAVFAATKRRDYSTSSS
jgi:CheY-like chemotaxis protein